MINYQWYYLATGHKQHVVRASELARFPQQVAICGCQVLSFLPPRARWLNDQPGLDQREKCKTCVTTLEKEQPSV